jgi:hypothetical protein
VVDGEAPGDDLRSTRSDRHLFRHTSGDIYGSRDEGRTFRCLARHLPHIYALEAA